jgi:DNA-binding CsgD family transcriptional regulator
MTQLAIEDTQKLHYSIQQLYSLHDLDTFGVKALSIVNRIIPSEIPVFHLTNLRTHEIEDTFLPGFSGLTPELKKIKRLYLDEHPLKKHMAQTLHGTYKISDFVSTSELHRLEGIYQQFLRPLETEDQMAVFLPNDPANGLQQSSDVIMAGFALNRSQCSFTERDRTILSLLRPHLFQAYANAQKYQKLQQDLDQLQDSLHQLGLIIVDTTGQVQSIAPPVAALLATYFPQSTNFRRLPDHLWTWVKHQVTSFNQTTDLPQACLPLRIQLADRQLVIRLLIEQSGERYLMLLEEQMSSLASSLALLGLSQRETEVLYWVMQGKDNKIIAAQLGISTSTIRKHLENIYYKLDVQSRTEAIAHALEKLGLS